MRRKIAAFVVSGLLAGGMVANSFAPAEATHSLRHLIRQVNRLEDQVAGLKQQVAGLNREVFNCEFVDTSVPKTFPDGSTGFPVYEDSTCL